MLKAQNVELTEQVEENRAGLVSFDHLSSAVEKL